MGNPFGRNVIVPLVNKSGASVAAGDFVYVGDGSNADSFTTGTTANRTGMVGIAQATIGNAATGLVLVSGYASLVNVNASVTINHFGASYTVAKQATDVGTSRAAGTCLFFLTGGTTPDAILWQPDLGAGSGITSLASAKFTRTTGDYVISSSGWAAVDGTNMALTITTGARRVLVTADISCYYSNGALFCLDVDVDGTRVGDSAEGLVAHSAGTNVTNSLSFAYLTDTLSAASHTFKLFRAIVGGTSQGHISGGSGGAVAVFAVMEQAS